MDSCIIDLNYILKMFAVKIPFINHFFSELNFLSYKWMWSSCSQGQDCFQPSVHPCLTSRSQKLDWWFNPYGSAFRDCRDSACLRIGFWQGCSFDLALFATLSIFHTLFFCLCAECEVIFFSEPEIHRSAFETPGLWIFTWKGSMEAKHNLNWTYLKKKVQIVFVSEYSKVGKESLTVLKSFS